MRTQFGNIPLMALLAASLTAGSGCSDLTLGQTPPPKGGPKLTRLTIQDYAFVGGPPAQRAAITDLLDNTPQVACAVNNPCVTQFLIAQTFPDLTCHSDGFCVDPLKVPSTGVQLNGDNTAIRVVFNKQLNPNIETIKVDANGAQLPGQQMSLNPGILELLNPDGTNFPITGFWDNEGASTFTSDVIWIPFGPAIVTNPLGPLNPSTTYTIRLHTSQLKSEQGEAVTDASGAPLGDPTDFKFTTEDLTPNLGGDGDYSAAGMATIAPNDVVQYPFWESVDETTVTIDPSSTSTAAGFNPAAIEAYDDRGADPTMCAAAQDTLTLNLVYTSGTGATRVPADWPAGDYSIVINAKGLGGAGPVFTSDPIVFTVAGSDTTDPTMDPIAVANHVTPEQCK